jgi:MoxR-like ATPase
VALTRKFYGDDALVDRAIVTLMSQRGLLLVGEPGTAKSMLSELLAAAVSGDSTLTVQGSAGDPTRTRSSTAGTTRAC